MTNRNDGTPFLPEPAGQADLRQEPKHLKKCGRKRLFRFGVSCLSLLLATALLLVGSSFSYFSSGPAETEGFPDLTVATFNVTVEESGELTPGEVYGKEDNRDYVAYAFDVFNGSEVPVNCNMELNIAVKYEGEPIMKDITFYLCENGYDDSEAMTNFDGNNLEKPQVLSYNSEAVGGAFYLPTGETKTFVLVADCSGVQLETGSGTADNYLYLSNNNPNNKDNIHAITVTAEQAAGEGY